jgi:hypothetical protein
MDPKSKKDYLELKSANRGEPKTLIAQVPIHLPKLLKEGSLFKASIKLEDW